MVTRAVMTSWLSGLVAIALLSTSASADPKRTPYDAGHITIHVGFYRLGNDYDGVRLGGGYNVIQGLELGVAGAHLWGLAANVDMAEPFAIYNFAQWYQRLPLVPYVGLSYLHRWTAPMYYVPDAIGMRAGVQYTVSEQSFPVILGGGVVWNHPVAECGFDDCAHYGTNKEEVGPEVFAIVGF